MELLTYSNPRMQAVAQCPRKTRIIAKFQIEQSKRGQRALRQTTGAVKASTYAKMTRIVDGSDGKIYIAQLTPSGPISILRDNLNCWQEVIFQNDGRYAPIFELFAADAA